MPTATNSPAPNTSLYLRSEWNLVALPLHPRASTVGQALGSILAQIDIVYAYQGCDTAAPWKKYDPRAPDFVNDLDQVHEAMGLWIRLNAPGELSLVGDAPQAQDIVLCPGWNLVGFPAYTSRPVDQALSSVADCVERIYAYVAEDEADPWKKYDLAGSSFANDLDVLTPGQGYWILANQTCIWPVQP